MCIRDSVKDPNDHETLQSLKSLCAKHPGVTDIVLVLGDEKKSAIKLPFRIDDNDSFLGELRIAVGAEAVKLQ